MKITAANFRSNFFKLLDDVKKSHEPVIITKRGKPVAKVIHCQKDNNPNLRIDSSNNIKKDSEILNYSIYDIWEID